MVYQYVNMKKQLVINDTLFFVDSMYASKRFIAKYNNNNESILLAPIQKQNKTTLAFKKITSNEYYTWRRRHNILILKSMESLFFDSISHCLQKDITSNKLHKQFINEQDFLYKKADSLGITEYKKTVRYILQKYSIMIKE